MPKKGNFIHAEHKKSKSYISGSIKEIVGNNYSSA